MSLSLSTEAITTARHSEPRNWFVTARRLAWQTCDPKDEISARDALEQFEREFAGPPAPRLVTFSRGRRQ